MFKVIIIVSFISSNFVCSFGGQLNMQTLNPTQSATIGRYDGTPKYQNYYDAPLQVHHIPRNHPINLMKPRSMMPSRDDPINPNVAMESSHFYQNFPSNEDMMTTAMESSQHLSRENGPMFGYMFTISHDMMPGQSY